MILRDYQARAVDEIYNYFHKASGNPVLEVPTAAGKSLIQANFIKGVLEKFNQRVLCLTHVKELVKQNHDEMLAIWQECPAGIYSAGLKSRDTDHPVIFATIQSVYQRAEEIGPVNLIFIDEAHLVPSSSGGMYRSFLDDMARLNPFLKVIGLSATPYRLEGGLLIQGEDRLFTDMIPAKKIGATMPELIARRYLAPLVTPDEKLTKFDTDGVGHRGGEFIASQLNDAIDQQRDVTNECCEEIISLGKDRKKWIIFATSIDHAEYIAGYLWKRGILVDCITSKTVEQDREIIIEDFRSGGIRCLVSVNVLSTGFNVKQVDLIAMMRPTESASMYVQQAGRGMRVAPGKTDCLVLDFAGNIDRHGPVDDVKPPPAPTKRQGTGEVPLKECDECFMLLNISVMTCPFCGYEFPPPPENIRPGASTASIIGREPVIYKPTRAMYSIHKKAGKPDSLKVSYFNGISLVANDWICLFHGGRAQWKAENWWRAFVPCRLPDNIGDALSAANALATLPLEIHVDESGKYPRIVGTVVLDSVTGHV